MEEDNTTNTDNPNDPNDPPTPAELARRQREADARRREAADHLASVDTPRYINRNGRWVETYENTTEAITRAELHNLLERGVADTFTQAMRVPYEGLTAQPYPLPVHTNPPPVLGFATNGDIGTLTAPVLSIDPTITLGPSFNFDPQPDITALESVRCAELFMFVAHNVNVGDFIARHGLARHFRQG